MSSRCSKVWLSFKKEKKDLEDMKGNTTSIVLNKI